LQLNRSHKGCSDPAGDPTNEGLARAVVWSTIQYPHEKFPNSPSGQGSFRHEKSEVRNITGACLDGVYRITASGYPTNANYGPANHYGAGQLRSR
jgi:hypothetical protein